MDVIAIAELIDILMGMILPKQLHTRQPKHSRNDLTSGTWTILRSTCQCVML